MKEKLKSRLDIKRVYNLTYPLCVVSASNSSRRLLVRYGLLGRAVQVDVLDGELRSLFGRGL